MADEEGVCAFCHRDDISADIVGDTLCADGLTVHHHCLYFSSGLAQRGKEDEGIQGFLVSDIEKEIKRGQRCKLKCFVCGQKGAYVGCSNKRCKRTGHFPCLQKHGFLFQFWGSFSAYCQKHCPTQPPLEALSPQRLNCSICVCQVPSAPSFDVLYSPCCKAVLHRECIQKYALNAGGYFFRCPLCNNNEAFVQEMLRLGISIPERDATWESCGQFNDLYEVTKECTAEECVCPDGRTYSAKHGRFRFLRCKCCGRYIAHLGCSDDHLITSGECRDCVLASAHNTPQATPTSCPAGGERKPTTSTTAHTATPTTTRTATPTATRVTTPTTTHVATPTVVSNVLQMLACSCAICEARRGTAQTEGVGGVRATDGHSSKGVVRGVVTSSHPDATCRLASATTTQSDPPVSQCGTLRSRKRCLEYPSDELRPKMDKRMSPPPQPIDSRHALPKSPSLPLSKVSGPTLSKAGSASNVSVPAPPSLLPPAASSPSPPPKLASEVHLSRALTYHQVMRAKAKHGGNRLKL